MRRATLNALLACAVAFAAPAQDAGVDLAPLQGQWTVTAAEQGGQPFDAIKGGVLTIEGDAFTLVTASGNKLDGKVDVDASESPQTLDFLLSSGAVWQAIYAVNGDIFRLNYVEQEDGPRPTVFATTAESLSTVIVMRRGATLH